MRDLTFDAAFIFCGLGLGARGFLDAEIRLPNFDVTARFRSVGGIDFDRLACADFEYMTGSPALCADVAELTVAQVHKFFGRRAPHALFWSPPCKGASGLLSAAKAKSEKYSQMNELALSWLRLMLKAWPTPPKLLILENVPRLKSRAPEMLAELVRLLRRAGYVVNEGFHDCGEVGGLAQHRRRYLMVARQHKRCPPVLYQPPKKRVRGCGEVLGELPVPGTAEAGAWGRLHELPKISWLNWVRLALIPAGGDWRDLEGVLAKGEARREKFKRHAVESWDEPTGTVAADGGSNGVANVADPRARDWFGSVLGVTPWQGPSGVVTGAAAVTRGAFAVADPRIVPQSGNENMHWGKYQVHGWSDPTGTVHGASRVGSGAPSVADPRVPRAFDAGYAVLRWDEAARTIAGQTSVGCGAYAVGDPRVHCAPRNGAYGVLRWDAAAKTITGSMNIDNSTAACADPRKPPPFLPVIIAADGTWHRPMTTLELAALQGFPMLVNGKPLQLAGSSASAWRERIGNAVPAPAAAAIAESMLVTLAESEIGTFSLSSGAVWVEPREALHG
jgi:site-specific DNA-cytosine methylase